jgi:hypothetical protein
VNPGLRAPSGVCKPNLGLKAYTSPFTDEKGNRVTNYQHPRNLPHGAIARRGTAAGLRGDLHTAHARSSSAVAFLALAAALLFLTVLPSVASAKQARLFSGSFGEASSTPADPYPLSGVGSVAVDSSSHDVYVGDGPESHRVEKFDSSGHFLFMLGLEVNKTAVEESATRKSEENICPAAGHPADVCQPGTGGAGAGAFLDPQDLAVDNSASPSKGDLYAANTGEVDELQTVTVTATGGTFTLSFEGETTSPITFNASADEDKPGSVPAALQARPKMEGISATGSPGKIRLEFIGPRVAGNGFPAVGCDGSALSGPGASCVVAVQQLGFSANVVEKFDSSGQPVTSWGEGGVLDAAAVTSPPAPVAGPFQQIHGLAVDTSGNLWVSAGSLAGNGSGGGGGSGAGKIFEFGSDSGFLSGWTGYDGELAVDVADNLYFSNGPIGEYTSVGKEIGVVAPSASDFFEDNFTQGDETLDATTGSLYLAGTEGFLNAGTLRGVVKRYEPSTCHPVITHETPETGCAAVESFGAGLISPNGVHPVAVDPATNALYVGDQQHVTSFSFLTVPDVTTTKPAGPSSSSATLTGVVNPSGVELNAGLTGCRFEWGETVAPYEHTVACNKTAAQIGKGSELVEVDAVVSGLQAGKTYHYRLVASNANDVNASITDPSLGADISFGPPLLESASALDVTATSATIEAQVNPNDLDTHVRVEYGAEAGAYTQSTPASDIGSEGTVQAPTIELSGLASGSVYHYRVVAENVLGEGAEAVDSPDHTLTTQTASALTLPDDRGWELVSPPAKHGAIIHGPSGLDTLQAAASGNAISYPVSSPTESGAAGDADNVQVLSARSATGWISRDIVTPNSLIHGAAPAEYRVFSPDLSLAILEPDGGFSPEISPEASEQTPYLRTDFPPGDPAALCTINCYRPLVTGAPGFANVPPETKFGREQLVPSEGQTAQAVSFLGASLDTRHIVLQSTAPLVEGAPEDSLYEWVEGRLELISILPGGTPASKIAPELGGKRVQRTAISLDGSRVVWSEGEGAGQHGHLYLRDVPGEQTLQIDHNEGGSGEGPVHPAFQMASADGSVVFFTDEQRLTPDSGAAKEHADLYRCEVIPGESGELECLLTDLSPANGTESGDVRGVLGASNDGSSLYFVANGVLAHNQVDHGSGTEEAAPGGCGNLRLEAQGTAACNLYLHREGATIFIARLSAADYYDFSAGGPARVSSTGRWLAFMSQRSLTGYDNRDFSTGKPAAEVYLYNADAGPRGLMLCASCNPSGGRPYSIEYYKLQVPRGLNSLNTWESRALVAGFLVGANQVHEGEVTPYAARTLSDSGRVFFDSTDGLVSQDTNGTEDVYEFEPLGVGTCTEATATFVSREGGCVSLISSGASGRESAFLDASESGDDAYFMTAAKLSPLDTDGAYDVYDARVGGGDSEPEKPIECQGDACQGFVAPPNDATPDSLTFSGPGNLKPLALLAPTPSKPKSKKCPKGEKLKHHKCVKAKKASRSKRKAHKTTSKRRAK